MQPGNWITKIKDIYSLLALFLLAVESALGTWLVTVAQTAIERMYAGSLMTIIFLVFLFIVPRI